MVLEAVTLEDLRDEAAFWRALEVVVVEGVADDGKAAGGFPVLPEAPFEDVACLTKELGGSGIGRELRAGRDDLPLIGLRTGIRHGDDDDVVAVTGLHTQDLRPHQLAAAGRT